MHFTEDEIREIRNRLPLEVPTVTDSLQSSDGSSALSAKQGNLLGGRLALVESTEAAMRNIQTINPWNGSSGVYSMVSVPDDTVNNATNVRVAYELKKRTDDLSTQVNYIQQIIDQLTSGSGGGGGGSTVSWGVELSNNTVPLIVNGVSKTICLNGYSSGGGGGTGGGYIGTTEVKSSSTPGQNLEGIGNATLSGSLSVTGTSTLTGNVTIGGTVFLPATGKIVFGSNASTDPFIEYVAGTTNQFHFNKGLYSDYNVTAGGVGTGGGGGGGASTLKDLNDVYDSINPSVGDVLYYTGSTNKWDAKALSIKDLSDVYSSMSPSANQVLSYDSTNGWTSKTLTIQELAGIASPTTGYLKYNNGAWSLAEGTSGGGISSVTWDTTGITTTGWTPIGDLVVDGTHSTILAPAGGSGSVTITGKKFSSSTGSEMVTINGEKLYCAKDTWRHVIVGSTEVLSNNDITALKFDGSQFSWSQYNGITYIGGGGSHSSVGSLSISSSSQSVPSSAESFANSITLHKIAKTGSYNDLSNTPTIPSTLDDISNGSSRKLPIDVSTSIGGTAGQPTVEAELIYSGTTTTAQLPFAECATVVQTAGIVSTVSQNFTGKKTFSSDVTVGPYSNQTSITRSNEPKLYFGRSINRTTSYPQTLDNVVANTAEGYYMLYDPSTNEKCLHLYCGYNDAGTDVLTNVNHKFVIHGDLVVDGNIIAASQTVNGVKQNGNVLAEGAVTAGESSV